MADDSTTFLHAEAKPFMEPSGLALGNEQPEIGEGGFSRRDPFLTDVFMGCVVQDVLETKIVTRAIAGLGWANPSSLGSSKKGYSSFNVGWSNGDGHIAKSLPARVYQQRRCAMALVLSAISTLEMIAPEAPNV